jgi:outer membrane protein
MRWNALSRSLARTAVAFIATATFASASGRASAEPLDLAGAVSIALESSPVILEARANESAARAGLREAQGARLPSIEAREIALKTDSPADAFGLQLMQERFSFPAFTMSDPNDPSAVRNYASELQATLPLFAGGRIGAGIAQAGRMRTAASAVAAHTEKAVALAVANAYMDVLAADRAVELAAKARETTARHVEQATNYYDAGMIVESDLLQARVQLARMDEMLITARNNARLARAGLNLAMGVDESKTFELNGALPDLPIPTDTLEGAIAAARERRGDLHASAAQVEAATKGVSRAKGELLPEIALVGKYSLNDNRIFGSHGTSYAVMAMARWNIFDGGRNFARIAQSRSALSAARESYRLRDAMAELEVRRAWQGIEEARARNELAAQSVASAARALAILEDRFSQGIAKVTDLLDAETMLNEARLRELTSGFDLQRSIRTLYFSTGLAPVPEMAQ